MPSAHIVKKTVITRSPRVMQLEGLFEVSPTLESIIEWHIDLPLESIEDWNVGLIVGNSGSGKSTVAKTLFPDAIVDSFQWSGDRSIIDSFPQDMSIKEITQLLSSVGFNSPPSWLRPFHVLSNGEQFRVTIARALAENPSLIVMDEFTSVVDRTVAQIGSHAIQKAVRRRNQQFIAVSCHYDILDWLEPDWILEMPDASFRVTRGCLRRPSIHLTIKRVHKSAWQLFKRYHYLNSEIASNAQCFVAFYRDRPIAFTAVISFPHPKRPGWTEHRTVCLPDFQGIGIGNALSNFVASLYKAKGVPYRSVTSNPAMIRYRAKSSLWKMTFSSKRQTPASKTSSLRRAEYAINRLTASFEYVGKIDWGNAKGFGIV